ncbi:MAG TPA: protein kinase [Abditibacterium sp.]
MQSTVTLAIGNGPLAGRKYQFSGRTRCIIGRGQDCTIPIPESYGGVSRHHCVIEIGASGISVRDLGSLNGTYLNGKCIGRREKDAAPGEISVSTLAAHELNHGDELQLGHGQDFKLQKLTIRIEAEISRPAIHLRCVVCGNEAAIPAGAALLDRFVCQMCRGDCEAMKRHLEANNDANVALSSLSNYELLQKIGRGGFGSVFLARHRVTNRKVALKVMLPHLAHDPLMQQIFEREIENMKALRHRHVVELFEDGCADGVLYFTMEFCALGNLSGLLKRRAALEVDEALRLIHQAIDGLQYAHQASIPHVRLANGAYASGRGLVHRDIKPCNLLLAEVGGQTVLKVGDYGLSKVWEQAGYSGVTRPGTKAGSFAFQPRQQVHGYRDSQPAVDVWAMAATLYFLLTGATPRDFPPHIAPELVVLQHPAIPIRERNSAVPRRLAEAIDTALIDHPDLVVKDIAAFKRSLELAA